MPCARGRMDTRRLTRVSCLKVMMATGKLFEGQRGRVGRVVAMSRGFDWSRMMRESEPRIFRDVAGAEMDGDDCSPVWRCRDTSWRWSELGTQREKVKVWREERSRWSDGRKMVMEMTIAVARERPSWGRGIWKRIVDGQGSRLGDGGLSGGRVGRWDGGNEVDGFFR